MAALLETRGLVKEYPLGARFGGRAAGRVAAVDGVDLVLSAGETLAVVGESGSGKSTLARLLVALAEPTRGEVRFDGKQLARLPPAELRHLRPRFQLIFQESQQALDPRQRVGSMLGEALTLRGRVADAEQQRRIDRLLERVGLPTAAVGRWPHEFSGGQRQRLGIARALATDPDLLIADEPVAALDPIVQSEILRLLAEVRLERRLALLLIAHDLGLVERLADRVAVLFGGRIVELGPAVEVFSRPLHPHTVELLAARAPDGGALARRFEPASAAAVAGGCAFRLRCAIARPRCQAEAPLPVAIGSQSSAACHYPGEAAQKAPEPG